MHVSITKLKYPYYGSITILYSLINNLALCIVARNNYLYICSSVTCSSSHINANPIELCFLMHFSSDLSHRLNYHKVYYKCTGKGYLHQYPVP